MAGKKEGPLRDAVIHGTRVVALLFPARKIPATAHAAPQSGGDGTRISRSPGARDWALLVLMMLSSLLVLVSGSTAGQFGIATIAGTFLLAVAAVREPTSRRQLILMGYLLCAALFVANYANELVVSITPRAYDQALSRMDHGTSVAIFHYALGHVWFRLLCTFSYMGLPLFAAFILTVSPRRVSCAVAWVLAAVPAPLFYFILPAVGPAHAGNRHAPRNCVPSLHMAWALICVVYAPRRVRPLAILCAVLTAVSTLGTGEHYLFDLAVAVPYALAICQAEGKLGALWSRMRSRQGTGNEGTELPALASD